MAFLNPLGSHKESLMRATNIVGFESLLQGFQGALESHL
jgi:hypothetical protein